jgi:hypothetical protein
MTYDSVVASVAGLLSLVLLIDTMKGVWSLRHDLVVSSVVGLLALVLLGLVLLGCGLTPPVPSAIPPRTTTVRSARPPAAAYACATATFARQPMVARLQSDPQTRTLSGQWHNAVEVVMLVEPHQGGSLVTIQCSVPSNKVTTGVFDEPETLQTLIREQCS